MNLVPFSHETTLRIAVSPSAKSGKDFYQIQAHYVSHVPVIILANALGWKLVVTEALNYGYN